MTIELITLYERNAVFYAALGPVLGNWEVAKEMDASSPIYHREGKTWTVVLHRGEPRAWAAVFLNLHNPTLPAEFGSAFVLPDWRGKGYYKALIQKRLELVGEERHVVVRARPASAQALVKYGGFTQCGVEDGYKLLVRPKRALRALTGATLNSIVVLLDRGNAR